MTDIPEDVLDIATRAYAAAPQESGCLCYDCFSESHRQRMRAALSALRAAGYEVRPRDVIARVENLLRLICDNAVDEETSTHVVVSWDDGIASLIFNDAQRLRKMLAPPAPVRGAGREAMTDIPEEQEQGE